MGKVGIIGGSGFTDFKTDKVIFLKRHGDNIPPHKVDHKRNILSLKEKGVTTIIGICSVGSLKQEIPPGTLFIPNDYINFSRILTIHEKATHIVPGLDQELRNTIINTAKKLNINIKEGVYWQTHGPRLETKAEINLIKNFADVVGMTMANEATIAKEAGLKYACICSVDNFANGISGELSIEDIKKNQALNREKIQKLLGGII